MIKACTSIKVHCVEKITDFWAPVTISGSKVVFPAFPAAPGTGFSMCRASPRKPQRKSRKNPMAALLVSGFPTFSRRHSGKKLQLVVSALFAGAKGEFAEVYF